MQIQVLCVGRIKDSYLNEGIAEFAKRLRPYTTVFVTELAEVKVPESASPSAEMQVKEREGEKILAGVKPGFLTIALDPRAPLIASEEIAAQLGEAELSGKNICFIIGGPLGLGPAVLAAADRKVSFSRLTFTHTMIRLILFEQIYRGFRILRGEPYHK
ncbi:23S rRNA (pseudouridine(1915)-N(3))-methyltransferase RlmH [Methanocorpusculum vombati]|uniref:Putative ribosomal RNA large subunit methyltransferase H n=1 Tax=Methanocorpusculum vombati TaxID=3002864 RepID=A0ABT4IMC2_9EURY|nr:23S rRNA (pseudouridine(1915)-N(3))-methyltransferase RlmH [Methanocorpusculum vombati]MCZ9319633.1 23S rRNA (pseudouridine(1915)-N(3))-methyltransferase RlmH [Methanocorpusculum sp.]MCZ0862900.1 23S rRNA (pseudouridine(1915)-N(3))-methyltransferase RlmH [Methanocorpusculum vombati]MDE2520877.1 23S rRNA (pseudouridine(1915)-N(3))-methyltransferase RlmH [Methanocorpusculum sp.]MDE2533680.1 23S rRNA (pseudouridine(1915)-N(3))-methyltransferase RlmH [Methanocorpusculum sp.]MDE2546046.1 23S rRN